MVWEVEATAWELEAPPLPPPRPPIPRASQMMLAASEDCMCRRRRGEVRGRRAGGGLGDGSTVISSQHAFTPQNESDDVASSARHVSEERLP